MALPIVLGSASQRVLAPAWSTHGHSQPPWQEAPSWRCWGFFHCCLGGLSTGWDWLWSVMGRSQCTPLDPVPYILNNLQHLSIPVLSSWYNRDEKVKIMLFCIGLVWGLVLVFLVWLFVSRLIISFFFFLRKLIWWVLFSRKIRLLFTHFV